MPMTWQRGPTKRHVAPDHVDELRQLVDIGPPEEGAEPRDARIAGPDLVDAGEIAGLRLDRAELQDPEDRIVLAPALLNEQDRPAALDADGDRQGDEKRRQHDKRDAGAGNVHQPLEGEIDPAPRRAHFAIADGLSQMGHRKGRCAIARSVEQIGARRDEITCGVYIRHKNRVRPEAKD